MSALASRAGVWQGLWGSVFLMLFVILLAFPIGIGAAIYLEEYAADNALNRFMTANIRNLAGVPSIVYGLLGLAIFVLFLRPITGGLTVVSGGLTLAVLVLPIVIITSMEAVRAVPHGIREAAYGVGATKWQVIRHHVLPYAAPGIFTGSILTISRAFGETAPLVLAGGVLGGFANQPGLGVVEELRGPYTALPLIIFNWARQPTEQFRQISSAAIIVLLIVILLLNAVAILLRNRFERRS
jgi:phosphate transport system permease protein